MLVLSLLGSPAAHAASPSFSPRSIAVSLLVSECYGAGVCDVPELSGVRGQQQRSCAAGGNPFAGQDKPKLGFLPGEEHYRVYKEARYGSQVFRYSSSEALGPGFVVGGAGVALIGLTTLLVTNLATGNAAFYFPARDIGVAHLTASTMLGLGGAFVVAGAVLSLLLFGRNWRLPDWSESW